MTESVFEVKRALFERWAPWYDTFLPSVFYRAVHQRLVESIQIPAIARVLDIGCGTGRLLQRLATAQPDLTGVGVDLSPQMIHQAQRLNAHLPQLTFIEGRSDRLPLEADQFDQVFCCISFLHYPDPRAVLEEVRRVLKPGGVFHLVDYLPWKTCPLLPTSARWVGGVQFYDRADRERLAAQSSLVCLDHTHLMGPVVMTRLLKEDSTAPIV